MNQKKIKVLQVTGAMNRGGAEVMLMDIYRNISKDIHFDFLVNYKLKDGIIKGDFDDEIIEKGGKIKHIATQWDLGPIKYLKEFRRIIKEVGKPDVIHIHMNAKSGVISWVAKKVGIKKIIVHSHANIKFRGSVLSVFISKLEMKFQKILISKFATDYWGCSQEAIDSLFYKYLQSEDKCSVIRNAVDVKRFQNVSDIQKELLLKSYKITDRTLVLGNIGRIVKHKNVDFIVDILYELWKSNIDILFVFAGRADDKMYLKTILKKAKENGVFDKILYLENRDDVPTIVNTFDVFLGPALQEGFGLVALEAQAAGIPCVLYTGFPKSVDMDLNLVTFLDNFNPSEWANEILKIKDKKLIDKDVIYNQIANLGFDSVENAKKIEKLYRDV